MRMAVVFTKEAPVRFVSHLDVQRLFQRAFRRAKLPMAYSQGFNTHPLISFATALSVGMTSRGEYLDVILTEDMTPEDFIALVSPHLPEGVRIVEAFDLGVSNKSLTSAMRAASYEARVKLSRPVSKDEIDNAIKELLSNEIVIQKKTKGGIKPTDIRPMVFELKCICAEGNEARLEIRGALTASGGLNPEVLLGVLFGRMGVDHTAETERTETELERAALN